MTFSLFIPILIALIIIGASIIILTDDGDADRKLLWLIIIAVLPVVGLILYLLFGINYRHRKYFRKKHERYAQWFAGRTGDRILKLIKGDNTLVEERFQPFARLLSSNRLPGVSTGNDVEIITVGKRKLDALLKDIENAKEYIHFQYYLFGNDVSGQAVKEALMKKAREGVKVRILHENVANYDTKRSFYNQMRKAGVELVRFYNPRFHPLRIITRLNYRNHRKIVVIDGRIGYTGGMNIKDRYFTKWRDTHLRIIGPAVASLQHIFLDSWLTSGGELDQTPEYYFPETFHADNDIASADVLRNIPMQITPDEPDSSRPMLQLSYIWAIQHAKDYIWLQTPYFIPPASVLDALKTAALSGVDVRIMVPKEAENFFIGPAVKSHYKECLKAGIRIYERGGGFIHAKTFVADDYLSSVGSANIDNRSFNINYEVNTYIYSKEAALRNKEIFLKDLEISEEVRLQDWTRIPAGRTMKLNLFRIFSSQL